MYDKKLRKKELEAMSDLELTKYRDICKIRAAGLLSNSEQSSGDLQLVTEILISRGYSIENKTVKII